MTSPTRPILIAGFLALVAGGALAAASSVPANYTPDPALRTASRSELETRVRRACANTQARIQNVNESTLARPCGCYASRIMRGLDSAELDAYRGTGYFNDTARGKALAAIDACGLRRPI
jgi:hypothetical protein